MQKGNTDYIYKNDLDKACFQDDVSYGKFKDLNKRTQSHNFLRDKAFEIQNQQLANELYKPIIKNFKKEKFIHHLKTIFGGN